MSYQGIKVITTPNPSFNLQSLIAETIRRQDEAEDLSDDEPLSPLGHFAKHPDPPSIFDGPLSDDSVTDSEDDDTVDAKISPPPPLFTPLPPRIKKSKPQQAKKSGKPVPPGRQSRKNKAAKASRQKKRALNLQGINYYHEGRPNAHDKYARNAEPILCNLKIEKQPVVASGYTGLGRGTRSQETYTLEQMVGEGSKHNFTLQKWDGKTTMALVDANSRLIGILAGHPDDPNWPQLHAEAALALESRRDRCSVSPDPHRRGQFLALACGISHGGGQKMPSNLHQNAANEQVLQELNRLPVFKRIAGFSSSVLATWAPALHEQYRQNMKSLQERHPHLVRVFPGSSFAAASYNLGPQTVCYEHTDFGNYAPGMCSVTPAGDFDHEKGGHLILWDLHLVIEFPAGSTILIPSAIIAHSNVSIGENERRYSFAQYTAGALFRWVENGFQTQKQYLASLTPTELKAHAKKSAARWQNGLSLLPILHTEDQAMKE